LFGYLKISSPVLKFSFMNILFIHNKYGRYSGEEAVVEGQVKLMQDHDHETAVYYRSSEEITGIWREAGAFVSGFYNAKAVRDISRLTRAGQPGTSRVPSVVHIHNLYPLISPAVLPVIPPEIPVVMTVHNYRLICPNGLFFTHGEICEKCAGGHEGRCVERNCERSFFKSLGYALRNQWARKKRYYYDRVDMFLCLTEFQRNKLVEAGFSAERCKVIPNFCEAGTELIHTGDGRHVLFAGRLNQQKGFDLLIEAAERLPGIPFRVAGNADAGWIKKIHIPDNTVLTGNLAPDQLEAAFREARFLVFTSRSYEGFPMVILEAMRAGIPVIAPNMAGFPEMVEDGVNGLLFVPGDAADLAAKIRVLWEDRALCRRMGENGYQQLKSHYSPEAYYRQLMEVYREAGEMRNVKCEM